MRSRILPCRENTAAITVELIAALANQPLPLVAQDSLAYAQAKAVHVEPPVAVAPVEEKPAAKSRSRQRSLRYPDCAPLRVFTRPCAGVPF
jgi:hypothetical protein